jgi:D-glycero-alpha-D-manno-heptose-7-phosphate kinase
MRVSFAGGGSDVPPIAPGIGGRVVGAAVDLRVRVEVEPFDRGWVQLESSVTGHRVTRRRDESPRSDIDLRLLEAGLAEVGIEDGVRVVVQSPVAPGTGLGGSSSVAVALLRALRAAQGCEAGAPASLVDGAARLERERLRNAGGSQDATFAAYGGLLDLRFDPCGSATVHPLQNDGELMARFSDGVLLVDTTIRRVSGDALRAAPRQRSPDTVAELVSAAADVAHGFAIGSLDHVLAAMRRAADAKVRRDPRGCALAVDLAERLTPLGAEVVRTCGAGGGGHVLVWAAPERHASITDAVAPWPVRRPAIGAPGVQLEDDPTPIATAA